MRQLYRTRKAQITLFVIIAIVLLIGTALFFFLRNRAETPPEAEQPVEVEPVPVELEPLKDFVEQCMQRVSKDAIELLGTRAGYIYLDNFDVTAARVEPDNADLLRLSDMQYLPYWYYQRPSGLDALRIPKVKTTRQGEDSVELQFEDYLFGELPACFNGFAEFEEQGMAVTEESSMQPHVRINEDDVAVLLEYHLSTEQAGRKLETKSFLVTIPVRLGKILRLARLITLKEAEDVFLERAVNKFIAIYSDVDAGLLPPPAGSLRFTECSNRKIWIHNDVQDNLAAMLTANIPYIKIAGTAFERRIITADELPNREDREFAQAIYDNLIFRLDDERDINFPGIRSDLYFDSANMPFFLELGGVVLQPSSMEINLLLAQLCMFDYKFFYNLRFPVMIRLQDERSFIDNRPYTFMFPIQVVIRDNFPRVQYSSLFEEPEPEEVLPGEAINECLQDFRDSGTVSINVTDRHTGQGLQGVSVFFQCGATTADILDEEGNVEATQPFAQQCLIGSTDGQGRLAARLPLCSGASLITLRKNNYLGSVTLVGDIVAGRNESFAFELTPLVTVPIKVEKYYAEPPIAGDIDPGVVLNRAGEVIACNLDEEPQPTAGSEEVIMNFQKLDPENGVYNGITHVSYRRDTGATISLAPGRYEFDMQLLRYERFEGEMTIAKDSQSYRIRRGWPRSDRIIRYPSEDVLLPQTFTGGAQVAWTVPDDVYNAQEILFFVFDEDRPRRLEEIGAPLQHIEECSRRNTGKLMPVIVPRAGSE